MDNTPDSGSSSTRNLKIALRLLALGFAPVPCWHPGECEAKRCSCFWRPKHLTPDALWEPPEKCDKPGKHPRIKWKDLQSEPPTEAQVREWWGWWPQANIAMPTGERYNLVVVDADSPEAEEWCKKHLASPLGSMTGMRDKETGWRGKQIYMGHPGGSIRNTVKIQTEDGKLALDIRADGGYVMTPGSRHPSGVFYEAIGQWTREAFQNLPKLDRALLPKTGLRNKASAYERAKAWAAAKGPAVEGGGGDQHTFELANDLIRGFCLPKGEAFSIMMEWNLTCRPPWPDRSLMAKLYNAQKYGTGEYGYLLFAEREGYDRPFVPEKKRQADIVHLEFGGAIVETQAPDEEPAEVGPDGWVHLERFEVTSVPEFPSEALPEPLRSFIEEEAVATQTPKALPGMAALAVAAAAVAKKAKVHVKDGWDEPLNIYCAVVQPPGTRKSQVMRDCTEPLERFEAAQTIGRADAVDKAKIDLEILKTQFEVAKKKAANGPLEMRDGYANQAGELAKKIARFRIPPAWRELADDVTVERLCSLMSQQYGRIAMFSAEGGIFDMMGGRYSNNKTMNLDAYLKAHAGDSIRVDRVNRSPEFIDEPSLTMCLAIQPIVIAAIGSRPQFKGKGMLGRILYAIPEDMLGKRLTSPKPLPKATKGKFYRAITDLLELPNYGALPPEAQRPLVRFSPDALAVFEEFQGWVEPQLSPYGELGEITDWGGKLAGAIARIAGIFHMVEHHAQKEPWKRPMSKETLLSAIAMSDYLILNARRAYLDMEADPATTALRYLVKWIEKEPRNGFTERECFQATKRKFKTRQSLRIALELLAPRGYIRLVPPTGKERIKNWEVNPAVYAKASA